MQTLNANGQTTIGGSEISAVIGINRWKTPLALWAEKTGALEVKDISEVDAVKLGTELEDFVAQKFSKETGLSVRRTPKTYYHKENARLRANVDRIITGTDELLECKTASAYKVKEWRDDVPVEYILQVVWYLGITGRKKGYIAVLVGGQKFIWKEILADEKLFQDLVRQAENFLKLVDDKIQPAINFGDRDTLAELYPDSAPEIECPIETLEEAQQIETDLTYRAELMKYKTETDHQIELIENKIKDKMKLASLLTVGEYRATWKTQKTKRLDNDAIKKAGLYEKYTTEISTRIFRVTKTTKKEQ